MLKSAVSVVYQVAKIQVRILESKTEDEDIISAKK